MGDPAGIGPEVVLKALAEKPWDEVAAITVLGSLSILEATYEQLGTREHLANPATLSIIDWSDISVANVRPGQGDAVSGAASFAYLDQAITRTLAGEFDGIVTAPIAKSAWQLAGHDYPGQTEVLAQRAGVQQVGMMFVGRSPLTGWTLRTLLATTHIPLQAVPLVLTPELLTAKLVLLLTSLAQDFGLTHPTVAIAGLNPHSGEAGKLGREEQDWLIPWLEEMRQTYPAARLVGPIPPDTMWVAAGQAWLQDAQTNVADAFLALYHDQGLIPVKLLAFDQAINTTIGLPFVRTSPDHGTAFDIAGKGLARAESMRAAIELGASLVRNPRSSRRTAAVVPRPEC
jgi:4-hydroxythreonine-4-phosphate dehydrogenase